MELTRQKIGQYRRICSRTETREEIIEVIVPDTNPDFDAEISTFSTCRLKEKSLLSGGIKATGEIKAVVYYNANASENPYCITAAASFSHSYDAQIESPDDTLILEITVAEAKTIIVNSRKIKVCVKLNIAFAVMHFEYPELVEDVFGEQEEGICSLTDSLEQNLCVDINEKVICFTEEIRISNGEMSPDSKMMRWNSTWNCDDIKVLQNKTMIKGSVSINILTTENGCKGLSNHSFTIPFSQMIDCKNVEESDRVECDFSQVFCDIGFMQKDDGALYLVCEAAAACTVYVSRQCTVKYLVDMYSTEYDCDYRKDKSVLWSSADKCCTTEKIEHKFNISDGVCNIVDISASACCESINGNPFIRYNIALVYENENGEIKKVAACDEQKINIAGYDRCMIAKCCCKDISSTKDVSGVTVCFSVDVMIRCQNTCECEHIRSCTVDRTQKRRPAAQGNLILRYMTQDETLWSIAKQYGTTLNALVSANDIIDDQSVSSERLIMIPFVK